MTRNEIEIRFAATLDALEHIHATIALHETMAPKEHALIIESWKNKRHKVWDNFVKDLNAFESDIQAAAAKQQNMGQAA